MQSPFRRASRLLAALFILFVTPGAVSAQWFRPAPQEWQSGESYQGYWNPHYQPPGWDAPLGELHFVNGTGAPLDLYHQDRHGRWAWTAQVPPRATRTVRSPIGDIWTAQDRSGRVVQRVRAQGGRQFVEVTSSQWYPDPSGPARPFRLTFRNASDHRVNLYLIERNGRWSWVSRIPQDGEVQVRSIEGQRWRAINERGRTVKDYTAGQGRDTVVIRGN